MGSLRVKAQTMRRSTRQANSCLHAKERLSSKERVLPLHVGRRQNPGCRGEHSRCGERAQLLLEICGNVHATVDDLPAVQALLAVMSAQRTLGALLAPTP
jgi:hypothetical protein